MSKSRSKRFEMLTKLADHFEKSAAESLGAANKLFNDHNLKLDELVAFREEYIKQFQRSGQAGINAKQMQSFHAFLQQLDTVIEQQKFVVSDAKTTVNNNIEHWRQKHTKTKIYETTLERIQKEDLKKESKREQSVHDELSSNASTRDRD